MKKSFFLSKGLNKFSDLQISNMKDIKGGIATIPGDVIYYPTGGGGKRCPEGQVWSDKFGKCVYILVVDEKESTISLP